MKRLTSNKNVSEMGMTELAYNSCYRGGDGWARYRDYSLDIDAKQLARMLLKKHADRDDSFTDDEDFEGWMMDYLQDGIDSREGLIALFYRNLWVMADLRERLKYYEDLEERLQTVYGECDGLLKMVVEHLGRHEGIDFPGSVHKARLLIGGDVDRWEEFRCLKEQGKLLKLPCAVGDRVYTINTLQSGKTIIGETIADAFFCALGMLEGRFGKTIFLTVEEAKAVLKEL